MKLHKIEVPTLVLVALALMFAVCVFFGCESISGPTDATYDVDCSDPFNAPVCPIDLGGREAV